MDIQNLLVISVVTNVSSMRFKPNMNFDESNSMVKKSKIQIVRFEFDKTRTMNIIVV